MLIYTMDSVHTSYFLPAKKKDTISFLIAICQKVSESEWCLQLTIDTKMWSIAIANKSNCKYQSNLIWFFCIQQINCYCRFKPAAACLGFRQWAVIYSCIQKRRACSWRWQGTGRCRGSRLRRPHGVTAGRRTRGGEGTGHAGRRVPCSAAAAHTAGYGRTARAGRHAGRRRRTTGCGRTTRRKASRGGGVAAAQNVEGALFTKQIVIVSVNLGLDFLFSLITL